MRIHPIGERVLIKHKPKEEVTAGGVILPTNTIPGKSPTEFGTIVEVGEGVDRSRLDTGVEVVFHRHAGAELEIDGDKFQLLLEESILATVDPMPQAVIEGKTAEEYAAEADTPAPSERMLP